MHRVLISVTFTMLSVGVFGCSNPVCNQDVVQRLLEDCHLSVGSATGASCYGLEGAPETAATQAALDHQVAACEIADPSADASCLKTATCADIEAGACFDSAEMSSAARSACRTDCFGQELSCVDACSSRASWDACTSCELDCVRARVDCIDACPE